MTLVGQLKTINYSNGDYIVADENKLGYLIGQPSESSVGVRYVVMAVDYMAGGEPSLIDRNTFVLKKNIRPAIKADGLRFGVCI